MGEAEEPAKDPSKGKYGQCVTQKSGGGTVSGRSKMMVSDTAQGIRKGKDISAFGLDLLAHLHVINITVISKYLLYRASLTHVAQLATF